LIASQAPTSSRGGANAGIHQNAPPGNFKEIAAGTDFVGTT
jgi:hypothetical protein